MIRGLARLQRAGLATQSMTLAAAALASVVPAAVVAALIGGKKGVVTAAAAGTVCLAAAEAGLMVGHLLRDVKPGFVGFTAGMLPRMGIPLAVGVLLHARSHPVAEAGFLLYVLVLYPVVLAVETLMSLPATPSRPGHVQHALTACDPDGSSRHDAQP